MKPKISPQLQQNGGTPLESEGCGKTTSQNPNDGPKSISLTLH